MKMICFNNQFIEEEKPILKASNRGFKYGDGLFETMKWYRGRLLLSHLHFERLFSGLQKLQIQHQRLSADAIIDQIKQLVKLNGCSSLARIRLSVFRNDANEAEYIIEASELDEAFNSLNEEGWTIGVYPHARKQCDAFANLKSANYLSYSMADQYAKEQNWDEALVFNQNERIADGSKTNVFLIKGAEIITPALSEGCVSGVFRKYLLQQFASQKINIVETRVQYEDLLNADEVFLTNALRGIRWVRRFGEKEYLNQRTIEINQLISSTIFQ
jgi:branched-chain amino acid aminotransferase